MLGSKDTPNRGLIFEPNLETSKLDYDEWGRFSSLRGGPLGFWEGGLEKMFVTNFLFFVVFVANFLFFATHFLFFTAFAQN
jgi:hypothetical protein